jgi:CxxC motif-containing protein
MTVEYDGKKLISVSCACKLGKKYAFDEIQNPRRTLTSTVILNGGQIKLLPVKTDKPIQKDKIFDAMQLIHKIKADAPIKMGDVIYRNFTENGINLIAGKDARK